MCSVFYLQQKSSALEFKHTTTEHWFTIPNPNRRKGEDGPALSWRSEQIEGTCSIRESQIEHMRACDEVSLMRRRWKLDRLTCIGFHKSMVDIKFILDRVA